MSTINGRNKPVFNREEIRYSGQGSEISRKAEGPRDEIYKLMQTYVAAGIPFVLVSDRSPVASFEYTLPSLALISGNTADESPTPVYECSANFAEKDILDADIAAINTLTDAEKLLLRKQINGTNLSTSEQGELSAGATTVYNDIVAGVRAMRIPVPTLEVSKSVSTTYAVKAAITNAGRILATATVSANENIPATVLFDLPAGSTSKPNRAYGWLKHYPTVVVSGSNRFTVRQKYEYGLWSTTLYGSVV